jgi:[acyl-carrier-protein] S-malonyltransferase
VLAFLFPGQGSQRPGMGKPWEGHPSFELVTEASETAGRDVARLLLDASMEELTQTANAQLATFISSLVVLDALERLGIAPDVCAGHSLGEYTALVASGAMRLDEGVALVVERGEAMAQAASSKPGTMCALLGIDFPAAQSACSLAQGDVWVANDNAPGQVVIAGSPEAVDKAVAAAKELGARKAMPIPVGGAFHTPFMEPARERLRKALSSVRFEDPEIAVVANVDARAHKEGSKWPELLSAQLCSPVRWRESLLTLDSMGASALVEVGPGGVLAGLARRTLQGIPTGSIAAPEDLEHVADLLSGQPSWQRFAHAHTGEPLDVTERLVVSPAAGVFKCAERFQHLTVDKARNALGDQTTWIETGTELGTASGEPILSPFEGHLVGYLVLDGERVSPGEPVAWLRSFPA